MHASYRSIALVFSALFAGAAWSAEPASKNTTVSVATLEAQCASGDSAACNAWVIRFNRGDVPSRDEPRLLRRFHAACTARKNAACYAEGVVLWMSKRDEKRGLALLSRACDGGSADACWELGDRESGAARVAAHRKGCALGYAASCTVAALDLTDGDIAAARTLAKRGCELGDASACTIARDLSPPFAR